MYFITTIAQDDTRCIGYYSALDKAVDAVIHNAGDMYEAGCYPYAVIENIREGIYQYDFAPIWFKYNEKTNKYERSDKPKFEAVNTVGFAIG